ncbi:MAG: hypothetical protein HN529_02395 [Acidiferrobacteraceae bacterium]|jgi:hypothetical protein|nr:hypothetical protein [Acidiferrobacteraceae bacterium]MBT3972951.1 hypothetical protein [Acidiferrobacteraceae bacterium]
MAKAFRFVLQFVLYGAFAGVVVYFSTTPQWQNLEPGMALIKVNFSHAGKHISECVKLTLEEMAELAENMRRTESCPRGRVPLYIEVVLDGQVLFEDNLPPSGFSGDGESTVFQSFPVEEGSYVLVARLRDSNRSTGYDYEHREEIHLRAEQNFVVDFNATTGGFTFL